MADQLADDLNFAITQLKYERDKRFASSLLAQHVSGKELSPNQMFWANRFIAQAGRTPVKLDHGAVADDIFAETAHVPTEEEQRKTIAELLEANSAEKEATATSESEKLNIANEKKLADIITRSVRPFVDKLQESVDEQERNLAARQQAFNDNAAKSIAQACIKEAMRQLDARVPRPVVITVKRADNSTHTVDGPQHPNFEKLLRALTVRKSDGYAPGIFLAGERGSGKTTGLRNAAKALGTTWYANGAIGMAHEMLGFIDGAGKYHRTPFREAYEFGGLYTFDEVDRSDPGALLTVNPHLANGEANFPDGMVKRHKDCLITATGNTWGLGASLEFSGACKLDEAFLSRFEIKLQWDVDKDFERKLVGNAGWYDYVERARSRLREAGIKYTIDSRAAMTGAMLIAQLGYTHEQAAQQTYLSSLKPDQRKVVEGLQ